jgi:hypothetical protein
MSQYQRARASRVEAERIYEAELQSCRERNVSPLLALHRVADARTKAQTAEKQAVDRLLTLVVAEKL